ncbi:neuronal acetylcholine receptor subunit non-alpha-2-like [Lineus longissimus]|uniref:neuronal acetylcholine receptor subunit non-alpha-2-like n=1 Tax=Lineus longissimus TaxID=88925 RepID=UPI00315D1C86
MFMVDDHPTRLFTMLYRNYVLEYIYLLSFVLFRIIYLADCNERGSSERLSTEGRLIKKLLSKNHYENRSRPVRNASHPLKLNVTFSLFQIIDVDDRGQTVTVAGYLDVFWRDENIQWNPKEYDDITTLVVPSIDVWVPDLGLINSVDGDFDFSRDNSRRVQITSTGDTLWSPGGIYRVGCSLDMTYFPFDRHRCKLTFSFWLHSAKLIVLKSMVDEAVTALYVPNGQWELERTTAHGSIISTNGNESDPNYYFSHLFVHVEMKRKPGFYIMNVILPCISISFLVLTLFYLPCDSGEKVSLGITVLLAFSVFQLAVADTMPKAFNTTPVILIYLSTLMALATISTILAVLVLNIHHTDGDVQLPPWVRTLVFKGLARIFCGRTEYAEFAEERVVQHDDERTHHVFRFTNTLKTRGENGGLFDIPQQQEETRPTSLDAILNIIENMYRDMCKFYRRLEERDHMERVKREWRAAARVIDRFFIVIFLVGSTAFTVCCLLIAPTINAHTPIPEIDYHNLR